ncbi:hypothetical protein D3C80_2039730 [compost metagenome]
MRLRGNRFRKAGLLEQHRYGVGFGTAIRGGDGCAADGLRQNLFGEIQERLVIFFGRGCRIFAFVSCAGQQGRQVR